MTGDELVALILAMPPEQRALQVAIRIDHGAGGGEVVAIDGFAPDADGVYRDVLLAIHGEQLHCEYGDD